VQAAFSSVQLSVMFFKVAFNKNQGINLDAVDFPTFRDHIKNCVKDDNFMSASMVILMWSELFKAAGCSRILQALAVAVDENQNKYVKNSKIFEKYKLEETNQSMGPKECILRQNMIILELKLKIINGILLRSLEHLDSGEKSLQFEWDKKNGNMLMEIYDVAKLEDPDFGAVPGLIENYEDAMKAAKLMSRLSKKRVDFVATDPDALEVCNNWMRLAQPGNCEKTHAPILVAMKDYYSGLAYYAAAKFNPDEDAKYKMLEKGIGFWDVFLKNDPKKIPEISKTLDEVIYLINDGYQICWNLKYKDWKKKPSDDVWKLVKCLVENRIAFAAPTYNTIADEGRKISTMYDLIKCHSLVLKNSGKAKNIAGELIDQLTDSDVIKLFYKISGVRVNKSVKKEKLVMTIIKSCQ
jgi:hypothetical protein